MFVSEFISALTLFVGQ